MKTWTGKSIVIIGILHSIVGLTVFRDIFFILFSERLFNTISLKSVPQRGEAFWFLYTGAALIIIGALVDWIERRNIGLPVFLLWSFVLITVAGIVIMPISGFWLLLVPTYGLRKRGKGRGISGDVSSLSI